MADQSRDGGRQQDNQSLPEGVTPGEVDPDGPLSYPEVRLSMRQALYESMAGTEYAREQGGWIREPGGVHGWLRRVFGKSSVFVSRAPSGTGRAINLGPRPGDAIGKFHTHPMSVFPVGSDPADLFNDVVSYVVSPRGVTRINLDNTQNYLGNIEDVLQ